MAKAIRWQVPFVSISGTHYRVDIYDEGYTGNPVQLYAGETPFVTNEDSSDDYFAPIRTQTGTLQVCTTLPNGGRISLDELLPANNIARPVLLNRVDANNNVINVDWRGFLSCEAYSQTYTAVPENINLSLIGILEAMDSVEIDTMNITGSMRGNNLLYQVLRRINTVCGITMVSNVGYSFAAWRILQKYFDTSVLFDQKEYVNENTISYTVTGLSCKEVLSRLCTFMGWTAREKTSIIYLQRIGEEVGMYYQSLTNLNKSNFNTVLNRETIILQSKDISTLEWRGVDHQQDVRQGAKSVEVVANIDNFDAGMGLPDFPGSDPTSSYTRYGNKDGNTAVYIENIIEQDDEANSRCSYSFHYGYCYRLNGATPIYRYDGTSTMADFISNSWLRGGLLQRTYTGNQQSVFYAGAALVRYAEKESEDATATSFDQGLYCTFLPGLMSRTDLTPIFSMKNPKPISLLKGTLNINADMTFIAIVATRSWLSYNAYQDDLSKISYNPSLLMKLRVGSKYWNGTAWTSTSSTFTVECSGSGINVDIPVSGMLFGESELSILPVTSAGPQTISNESQVFEAIFKSLNLSFTPSSDVLQMDRSNNTYYRNLGTNFRDEISVGVDFASYMNNVPSPSLIMNDPAVMDASRFMEKLTYNKTSSATEDRRPEVDLLNRLASYYGTSRCQLALISGHISTPSLPLLKLNGISPDTRKYVPLAESRDWREETCTLTCFETPT